jgi:hypothetical protein
MTCVKNIGWGRKDQSHILPDSEKQRERETERERQRETERERERGRERERERERRWGDTKRKKAYVCERDEKIVESKERHKSEAEQLLVLCVCV